MEGGLSGFRDPVVVHLLLPDARSGWKAAASKWCLRGGRASVTNSRPAISSAKVATEDTVKPVKFEGEGFSLSRMFSKSPLCEDVSPQACQTILDV